MHDVVVVGAGVAGLTAAADLTARGLDVVVVEARDRIGGRTHTVTLDEATVDLGGAWVHDPDHNPLTGYLASVGIPTTPDGMWGHGMRVFSGEGWLPTGETSTLVSALYNFDPDGSDGMPGIESDRLTDGIAWYLRSQLHPQTPQDLVEGFLGRIVGAGIVGDGPDDVSMKGMAVYEGEESGHNSVVRGGYRVLVEHLAKGLAIEMSTQVSEIRHSESGATVHCDERSFDAGWALVTIPLGVLKAESVRFMPGLPAEHRAAVARLKAKRLEKVAFSFEHTFWDNDVFQIAVLDNEAGFVWVHDLSAHSGKPILVGLYNPVLASSNIGGDDAVAAFSGLLEAMFGDVPDPTGVVVTAWAEDPFSLGSYSYIPIGASADDMETLAMPVGPRVLLAGEHTFPRFYGTVQAAWLSGKRAAATIARAF